MIQRVKRKFLCGSNTIFDMSHIVLNIHQNTAVVFGKNNQITGEFVDTSSQEVNYDFKDAEYNFMTIVKNITQ